VVLRGTLFLPFSIFLNIVSLKFAYWSCELDEIMESSERGCWGGGGIGEEVRWIGLLEN